MLDVFWSSVSSQPGKKDTHRAISALSESIFAEFCIWVHGVKTNESGKLWMSKCIILLRSSPHASCRLMFSVQSTGKKRYTPHKRRPERAHFGQILNVYALRKNDLNSDIQHMRKLDVILVYLSCDVLVWSWQNFEVREKPSRASQTRWTEAGVYFEQWFSVYRYIG